MCAHLVTIALGALGMTGSRALWELTAKMLDCPMNVNANPVMVESTVTNLLLQTIPVIVMLDSIVCMEWIEQDPPIGLSRMEQT
jgi:hypothetical protein